MNTKWCRLCAVAVAAVLALSACTSSSVRPTDSDEGAGEEPSAAEGLPLDQAPTIIQPGAPGEPNRELDPSEAAALAQPAPHTPADVRFMQMMIPHHAQALRMVHLIPDRTASEDLPVFARRAEISQEDEIAQMQRWLEARGEEAPQIDEHAGHGDHADHAESMPGMLTEEEFDQLEAASGAEFDRMWIEFMIRHHQGALTMVEELFATEGAGQETEVFRLATHIDSDQRIEIARMNVMLSELETTP